MNEKMPKRTRSTKRSPRKNTSSTHSHAVQMLIADHKLIRKLFDQFRAASGDEKIRIADRLSIELTIHSVLEEELFYPAVQSKLRPVDVLESPAEVEDMGMSETGEGERGYLESDDINGASLQGDDGENDEEIVTQAYEEHQAVRELLEQLKTLDPNGPDYQEVFTELEDAVIEHIAREEDSILPVAESQLDMQTLGAAMQRRRDDLSSSLAA
jgi:hemerythrin superfamily protein